MPDDIERSEALRDAGGAEYMLSGEKNGRITLAVPGGTLIMDDAACEQFELTWVATRAAIEAANEIVRIGPLAVVPLRHCIRLPGVGGARPAPVDGNPVDAGRDWTVRSSPAVACEWTRAYPPDGPDLGILRTGYGAVIEHPEHGALEVPPGAWVLRITRTEGTGNG